MVSSGEQLPIPRPLDALDVMVLDMDLIWECLKESISEVIKRSNRVGLLVDTQTAGGSLS